MARLEASIPPRCLPVWTKTPEIRAAAEALTTLVASKVPGGEGAALFSDMDALLAEARALALGRLLPAGGR